MFRAAGRRDQRADKVVEIRRSQSAKEQDIDNLGSVVSWSASDVPKDRCY
jgi:hypothetical protein